MIEYQVEFVPEDGSPIFICGGILMKFQRLISIVLTFVICLTLLAACSFKKDSGADKTTVTVSTTEKDDSKTTKKTTETTTKETETSTKEETGTAPVRTASQYAGTFGNGRCTIVATANGDNLSFSVTWGNSAAETEEWTMSGTFDPDTMRVNYSNCLHKTVVFDENGGSQEEIKYSQGMGRIQYVNENSLTWFDEQDNVAAAMTFTR